MAHSTAASLLSAVLRSSSNTGHTLTPSTVVEGRYRVERELGHGGMATVYLAHDDRHDAVVALKLLRPELATMLSAERFAREIRITARLQHPHVLPVLDSGMADGVPYYTMPYVAGETLADRLTRERQISIPDTVRIARQIADALAYAHAQGFVHRDIKPSNILLAGYPPRDGATSEWYAMLADFGIARAMDATNANERITDSGLAVGTAMYMSPEQSAGDDVDGRSDVYALGCVLYEMLAGVPPFNGPTPQAILARHAVDPVPSLRTVRATVSPALDAVIARALQKVPADRFPDAAAFRDALIAAGDATVLTTAAVGVRTTRRRRLALGIAGAALVAAGAATWLAWGRAPAADMNRVMVFPLDVSRGVSLAASTGEDVATIVGNALDGVGPLRWIDGWRAMDAATRAAAHGIEQSGARRLARAMRCGHFVLGRVVPLGGDSVKVVLELYDTKTDDPVRTASAPGDRIASWRPGLAAMNQLLPALLDAPQAKLDPDWATRDPGAVAQFLLGERALRDLHPIEALGFYREAWRRDTTFAFAALRGAQAASWGHATSEAESLVRAALRQRLPDRYRFFALGDQAYLEGRADSAARSLRRAVALDPEMVAAWAQLAETYTHLVPARGDARAMADSALVRAHALDPSASGGLVHLIELRVQQGRLDEAAALERQFRATRPDSAIATGVDVLVRCAQRGPRDIDWPAAVRATRLNVLAAARESGLEASGRCALAGFEAVLRNVPRDAPDAINDRWPALVGMTAVLIARGDTAVARARIDSGIAEGMGGRTLYLLGAPLVPSWRAQAAAIADSDVTTHGPTGFAAGPTAGRLWHLASWAATERPAQTATFASALARRADADTSGYTKAYARSAAALAMLANAHSRDDSTRALTALEAMLGEPGLIEDVAWSNVAATHGVERLLVARLRLARGDARGAIEVADAFDSMSQLTHLLFLPPSLELRAQAARALGNRDAELRYRSRLAAIRGSR